MNRSGKEGTLVIQAELMYELRGGSTPHRTGFLEIGELVGLVGKLRRKRLEERWARPRGQAWSSGQGIQAGSKLGSDVGQSIP